MPPVAKLLLPLLIGLMPLGAPAQLYTPPRGTAGNHAARPMAIRSAPASPSPAWSNGGVRPAAYETPRISQGGGALNPDSNPAPFPHTAESAPLNLSPPETRLPIGLEPPPSKHGSTTQKPARGWSTLVTAGSSLAVVLGLFFIFAWFFHRTSPGSSGVLPGEVVEVLGRAPLASKQHVHLLRCGKKLLLVSATQAGIETLTEITEPEEVDRLAGLCKQAQPGSSTALFRQVFQQYGRKETSQTRLFGRTADQDATLAATELPGHREGAWEVRDG